MIEPVISESLTLRYEDDGAALLTGFAPGPAGEVAIEVAPGMEVAFDAANPAQASSITVPLNADMELLAELIGEQRSSLVRPGSVDPGGKAVRLPRVGSPRRELASRGRDDDPSQLALTALSLSMGRDLRRSPLARAVALLEAFEARRYGVQGLRTDEAQLRELAEDAEDLVTQVPHEVRRLIDADAEVAERVAELFVTAEPYAQTLCDIGVAMRRRLGRTDRSPERGATARSKPEPKVKVKLLPNGRLQARGVDVEGQWIRVLRRKPLTLVAAAPFVEVGKRLYAEVVLPPDLTIRDLMFEFSVNPMPVNPSSPFEKIREAVMKGRRAVEYQHQGQHGKARRRWLACARLWAEVGDATRANRARAYAEERLPNRRRTTLSEEVQAVLPHP